LYEWRQAVATEGWTQTDRSSSRGVQTILKKFAAQDSNQWDCFTSCPWRWR